MSQEQGLTIAIGLLIAGMVGVANRNVGVMVIIAMYAQAFDPSFFEIDALVGLVGAIMMNVTGAGTRRGEW